MKDIELWHGDCLELLRRIREMSVSLFFCDLPYGCTNNKWDARINLERLWPLMMRAGKANATFIFTATQPFATHLLMSNMPMFRYELIWDKGVSGSFACAKKRPLPLHEGIYIFGKPSLAYTPIMTLRRKPILAPISTSYGIHSSTGLARKNDVPIYTHKYPTSIISISSRSDERKDRTHPTQKPTALLRWLIKTYSNKGDIVCDPVMGSGTTAVSAFQDDRRCIGIEQNEAYYNAAVNRVRRAMAEPRQADLAL